MDLIKTFEEACNIKGLDPEKVLPDVSAYPVQHQKALIATAKLFIINDVLNEGHRFDWNNDDEYKWYPWFDMEVTDDNPSGFGLGAAGYDNANSYVGSRLCYRTRDLAKYAGKQFEDLYKDLMVVS